MLFSFSLGMSTLLFVIAVCAGSRKFLPKSGAWMLWVKRFLASLLLGSGIYFIFQAGGLY